MMAPAALITLLVAAIEAFPMMMSAFMSLTAVMSTFMSFPMMVTTLVSLTVMVAMVVAFGVGIILQCPCCQSLRGDVCRSGHTAVKLDPRFGQRILRTHTNAAADQRINLRGFQEARQCAMPAPVGRYDLLGDNLAVLYVVELELFGMTEMLENLSVFVSYCDSHNVQSFLNDIFRPLIVEPIIATPDQKPFPIYQRIGDFPPCALVDGSHRRAGNSHPFGTLLLRHPLAIEKPDSLKLIQTQYNRLFVRYFLRREFPMIRVSVDPSAALLPGHGYTSFLTYVRNYVSTISDICQE